VEHRGVILAVNETSTSLPLQNVASSTVVGFKFETHRASEPCSAVIERANDATDALVLNVVPGVGVPAQLYFFLL
jgi:hypothetical protein